MSTIENKIVAMKLDNKAFEKGVATTISSLGALQNKMNFDGAKASFTSLSAEANKVNLSSIADDVRNLTSQFDTLKIMGTAAIAGIGSKITSMGFDKISQAGRNMIQGAKDGLAEYEMQIASTQTIFENVKRSGSTLDDVDKALDKLNKYSDDTIYNFTEMASAIGTFTVAGIGLDDSVAAIKGFSNMSALAGANATSTAGAMYQLAQAMSSGVVKLQDWMSIEKAGIAGAQMQDLIKETARANNVAVDAIIKKKGSFRASLSEDWLSAEIMTEALSLATGDLSEKQIQAMGYTKKQAKSIRDMGASAFDAATKIKTWTQVKETFSETTGSGWANSWKLIFGNLKQAEALWGRVGEVTNGFADAQARARNDEIATWSLLGGREALIEGIFNAYEALMRIVEPIQKAIAKVFPPTMGKNLATISIAFEKFTKSLIISKKASKTIENVFVALFSVVKIGKTIIGGFASVIGNTLKIVFNIAKGLIGLVTPIIGFLFSLIPVSNGLGDVSLSIQGFVDKIIDLQNNLAGPVLKYLKDLGKTIKDSLDVEAAQRVLGNIGNALGAFGKAVVSVYNILFKRDFTSNPLFQEDGKFSGALFAIHDAFIAVADGAKKFFDILFGQKDVSNSPIGPNGGITTGLDKLKAGFDNVKNLIGPWITKARDNVTNLIDSVKTSVQNGFANIDWGVILSGANVGFVAMAALAIKKAFKNIKTIMDAFTGMAAHFTKASTGVLDSVTGAIEGVTGVMDGMESKLKADALLSLAFAIGILALSLALLSRIDADKLLTASVALASSVGSMVAAMKVMSGITTDKESASMIVLGVALVLLATAVSILAGAMVKMGSLDTGELVRGLSGLVVVLGSLVVVAKVMAKFEKDIVRASASMILMASAVLLLSTAVLAFGYMNPMVFFKGMQSVGIAIGGLVAVAVVLSKFERDILKASIGMMAMAAAIQMLIIPITAMGLLPLHILQQGGIVIGSMLAALVVSALLLSATSKDILRSSVAIMAFAVAINMLVTPITMLGLLPMAVMMQGILALAGTMLVLVAAAWALQGAKAGVAGIVVVAAALFVLASAMAVLGSLSLTAVGIALLALAGTFIVLGLAAVILAPLIPVLAVLALSMGVVALSLLGMAGSVTLFAMGIMSLGPALIVLVGGLTVFAKAAGGLVKAVLPMLALGVGLLVFGVGAAVAAIGVGLLGAAFILLSTGLALIAITGIVGATAIVAMVTALSTVTQHIPAMLGLGLAMAVLAVGVLALGVGVAVLAAGLVLAGLAAMQFGIGIFLLSKAGVDVIPMIKKLAKTLLDLIPNVFKKVGQGIVALAKTLGDAAPSFVEAGVKILSGLLDGVVTLFPKVVDTFISLLSEVLRAIVTAVPMIVVAAYDLVIAIIQGLTEKVPELVTAAADLIVAFLNSISDEIPKVIDAAANLILDFINELTAAVEKYMPQITDAALDLADAIIDGVIDGLGKGLGRAVDKVKDVGSEMLKGFKNIFGIKSPSKEMEKIGVWINKGLVKGLNGHSRDEVINAIRTTTDYLKQFQASAREGVKKAQAALDKLNGAKKKDQKAIDKATKALNQATKEKKAAEAANKTYRKSLDDERASLIKLAKKYDVLTAKLEAARDVLSDKKAERYDYRTSVRDQYSDLQSTLDNVESAKRAAQSEADRQNAADKARQRYDAAASNADSAASAFDSANQKMLDSAKSVEDQFNKPPAIDQDTTVEDYIAKLKSDTMALEKFKSDLSTLRSLGLDDQTYQELLTKGIDSQPFVTKLIEGGAAAVSEIDILNDQLGASAAELGVTTSQEMYAAGVSSAKAYADGMAAEAARQAILADEAAAAEAKKPSKKQTVDDYTTSLNNQTKATKKYMKDLTKLRKMGLNDDMYQKLLEEGVGSQSFVDSLIASGKKGVKKVNAASTGLTSAAKKLGKEAASQLYDAGVNAAKGIADGLKKQRAALAKEMDKLADVLVNTLKKKLGIKSPSVVLTKLGKFAGEGFVNGLAAMATAVGKSANDLGDSAVSSLNRTISNMGSEVEGSMDLAPTIRPVLDLSGIQSDASTIGKIVNDNISGLDPIQIGGSRRIASNIMREVSENGTGASQVVNETNITYNQTNNSPKSLSNSEIYRQTRNQISTLKGGLKV